MRGGRVVAWIGLGLGVFVTAAGCFDFGELSGSDDASDGNSDASQTDAIADTSADSPTDSGIDAASNGCPSGRGPSMVRVPTITGNTYCIDSTEVTRDAYKAFLAANYPIASQPQFCAHNTTYTPDETQGSCPTHPFDPNVNPNLPVTCIDWCDARAFCEWAGKRLCGRIDSDGGNVLSSQGSAPEDEWYSACSDGGALSYPYGNTYDKNACKGVENAPNALLEVGSLSTCSGGYAGIFDMSGNAWEYENFCDDYTSPDGAVPCYRRGGSLQELSGQLTCGSGNLQGRLATDSNSGFRCCAN